MAGRARLLAVLGVSLAVAVAAPAGAGPVDVVDCNAWASFPNIKISSARDMSCRAAVREMRRYRGSISRRFRTPGGFRCERVSGGRLGGQWRCARPPQAFRFEFGD